MGELGSREKDGRQERRKDRFSKRNGPPTSAELRANWWLQHAWRTHAAKLKEILKNKQSGRVQRSGARFGLFLVCFGHRPFSRSSQRSLRWLFLRARTQLSIPVCENVFVNALREKNADFFWYLLFLSFFSLFFFAVVVHLDREYARSAMYCLMILLQRTKSSGKHPQVTSIYHQPEYIATSIYTAIGGTIWNKQNISTKLSYLFALMYSWSLLLH